MHKNTSSQKYDQSTLPASRCARTSPLGRKKDRERRKLTQVRLRHTTSVSILVNSTALRKTSHVLLKDGEQTYESILCLVEEALVCRGRRVPSPVSHRLLNSALLLPGRELGIAWWCYCINVLNLSLLSVSSFSKIERER